VATTPIKSYGWSRYPRRSLGAIKGGHDHPQLAPEGGHITFGGPRGCTIPSTSSWGGQHLRKYIYIYIFKR
jgi:hypothetical protein